MTRWLRFLLTAALGFLLYLSVVAALLGTLAAGPIRDDFLGDAILTDAYTFALLSDIRSDLEEEALHSGVPAAILEAALDPALVRALSREYVDQVSGFLLRDEPFALGAYPEEPYREAVARWLSEDPGVAALELSEADRRQVEGAIARESALRTTRRIQWMPPGVFGQVPGWPTLRSYLEILSVLRWYALGALPLLAAALILLHSGRMRQGLHALVSPLWMGTMTVFIPLFLLAEYDPAARFPATASAFRKAAEAVIGEVLGLGLAVSGLPAAVLTVALVGVLVAAASGDPGRAVRARAADRAERAERRRR